jgi:hypothetical protein
MWRYWRVVDPRKAIILTGLLIAFVSTSIHLIQISGDRYNINTWHPDTAKAAKAAQSCRASGWCRVHTLHPRSPGEPCDGVRLMLRAQQSERFIWPC